MQDSVKPPLFPYSCDDTNEYETGCMIIKNWRWAKRWLVKRSQRRRFRVSLHEQLERREMMAIDGWHNVLQPLSVLGADVSPLDVLAIINEINAPVYSNPVNRRLPENPPPDTRPPFYDVDCDGYVGPLDALNVINVLNGQPLSPGWKFHGEGNIASGFVSASACSPKIHEGTSYKTELVSEVTLPTANSAIRISFESPAFDMSSVNSIRDAFEILVRDLAGNTIVLPHAPQFDSVYNWSENVDSIFGPSVVRSVNAGLQVATVNLTGVAADIKVQAVVRLVNNDRDRGTSVVVRSIEVVSAIGPNPSSSTWNARSTPSSTPLPFDRLEELSSSFVPSYGRTTLTEDRHSLVSDLTISNIGNAISSGELIAVIDTLSDTSVELLRPDGYLPDGRPFLRMRSSNPGGLLPPGEKTETRELRFTNPTGKQFNFEIKTLGVLRRGSIQFASTPTLEIQAGGKYRYNALAKGADEAIVQYKLLAGPASMSINAQSGLLQWNTQTSDVGRHTITIHASDAYGLSADQSFSVDVRSVLVNRPPIITSTPETDAVVSSPFEVQTYATGLGPIAVDVLVQSNGTTSVVTANQGEQQLGYLAGDSRRFGATQPISIGEPNPSVLSTPFNTAYPVELGLVPNTLSGYQRDIQGVLTDDVNGDGIPDLIVLANLTPSGNWNDANDRGYVIVRLGNGEGTFRDGWRASLPVVAGRIGRAASAHIKDVTGDGRLDLIVTTIATNQTLVYPGNSPSIFGATPIVSANSGNYVANTQMADLNADGKPDLIFFESEQVQIGGRQGIGIQLGDGTGRFSGTILIPAANNYGGYGYVADVDGINGPDLIRLNYNDTRLEVRLNTGSGQFGDVINTLTRSYFDSNNTGGRNVYPTTAYIDDFDGDGKADALLSTNLGIILLKGQGDGQFGNGTQAGNAVVVNSNFDNPNWPGIVNTDGKGKDLNGDGKLDFVFGDTSYYGNIMIGLGNGNGTFQPRQYNDSFEDDIGQGIVKYSRSTQYIAVADFNRDGVIDLAVGATQYDQRPGAVGILLGDLPGTLRAPNFVNSYAYNQNYDAVKARSGESVTGDFNGDGFVDIVTMGGAGYGAAFFFAAGKGDGTFARYETALGGIQGYTSLIALDIDRDGKLDLAWMDGGRFGQAFGLGNGAFQYLPTIPSQGAGPGGVSNQILQTDDFNRDGYPDLVYRLQTGNIDTNVNTKIVVLIYDPANRRYRELRDASNLITLTPRAYGFYHDEALGMGDLNNDGVKEFFAFSRNNPNNGTPSRFAFYEQPGSVGNDASIMFRKTVIENPSFIPADQSIDSFVVGDFNHDGKNDIAYSTHSATTVVMFGNGDFTFRDPTTYLTNGLLLNQGDFNGDGLMDLATTWGYGFYSYSQRPYNSVLLGRADGTFSEQYGFTTATSSTNGLFVGDFNGDGVDDLTGLGGLKHNEAFIGKTKGLSDIATGDINGDGRPDSVTVVAGLDRVKLLHGVVDETFARQPDLFTDLFPVAVELVDADHDDLLDILTANQVGKSLSLFKHTSPTTYARTDIDLPVRPTELVLGDLNGDGKKDAVAISSLDQSLVGLLAGNDTFGISLILPLGFSPSGVAVGDVSGDGKLDLVLGDSVGDRLIVLQGKGDGTFLAPFAIPAIHAPGAIGIADMNADGRPDIVVAQPEDDRVALFFNRGNGRFTSPQFIQVGDKPVAIQIRDVNKDDKPDILVPNQDENTISVILNRFDPNQVWTYKPTATDPDGDTVTFDLTSAPGGMLYDSASNTIYWAPMPEQIGSNSVVITASDGNGGSTDQGFTVTVTAPVTVVPPIFTSTPVTTFGADSVYRYEPNVQAVENGPKRFSIVAGPAGMTIDPTTGVLEWDARSDGIKLFANFSNPGSPVSNQNNGQIQIPDSPSFRSASVTAEGWFNFEDPKIALFDQILSKRLANSGSSVPSWGLEYFYGTLRANVGRPDQSTSLASVTAPVPIEFNKWIHLALTFDDSSKRLTLYVNGKNVGSAISPESIGYNEQSLFIGSSLVTMSRVRVWNTARSESEIAALALTDIPSNTPSIVLDLKFQESKDVSTILDASKWMNHGSLIGTPDVVNFPTRVPALASQGSFPVTVRADDGKGGVTEQSFSISVKAPTTTQATGIVFDDVNGNGLWDRRSGENLVFNGDFGSGSVGYTTDFSHRDNQTTSGWLGNTQSTVSNKTSVFPSSSDYTAHTNGSASDLMLLANGDSQDRVAWRQTIATTIGQDYEFSFWAIRPNSYEAARLAIRINGQVFGSTLSLNNTGPNSWKRFFGTLRADSTATLIEIVLLGSTTPPNPGLSGAENVVGIDDILLLPNTARRVVVSGKANPYLAGMPDGSTVFGGTAPAASPTNLTVTAGQVLRINATGHTVADGYYSQRSTDGSVTGSNGMITLSAANGISQFASPRIGSLIGVFLDDNSPAGQTTPAILDFRATGNVPGGIDYSALQPQLRQVFFIGDGQTADGVEQMITVPAGATRLFFANSSISAWDLNSGEFEVQVFDSASEPVQANRRVFVDSNFNGRLDATEPSTITNSRGVYGLPIPGTTAQLALVGKEGEIQTAPSISYRTFDFLTDFLPIYFGSRDIALTESPRFTTQPITTAITPNAYRYQSFAQSPTGKPMTYALAVGPQGMSIDPSSGLVRWNPIASNRGDNEVILKATDADGKLTLQRYTINVEVNTIPIATSTPPTITLQNVPFQYRVLAQDAEQSTLIYSLTTAPAGMTIDAATGLIQWLPSSLTTENVVVKIDDQRGGIAEHTFSLAVQPAGTNHSPEFTNGPRNKAILGREFASRIGAIDKDNDVLTYTIVSGPSGLTISAQGEVYWQPSTTGSFDFLARVRDSRGGIDEQSYTSSVVSQAPAPDLQITSSPTTAAVVGNLFAYDVAANNGELFELVTSPSGMSIAPGRGTIRWVPTKDQLGVQSVKIRVTDVLGNMAEQSFVVAVRSSSLVPTISSAPLTEVAVGQTYVYAVSVANPSKSPLTYSLSVAPSGMQIDSALGVITWTPNSNQVGPAVVSIQVRDAVGSYSSQTFSVVVTAGVVNRPPVTTSTPSIDAVVGNSYAYTMLASDPEGGTVTYAVRSAPSGFAIHPSTGVVTWTPVTAEIGTIAIVLTAKDPQGGVAVQSIQIDVRAANRLPTIRSNPSLKVSQGALYQYDVLATDPDREPLFYSLVTAPAGMTIDALGRIRWQTQLNTPLGGRDVVVRAVDGLGGAVTQSFTFGVVADTLAPRITIIVGGEPVLYPWTSAPATVRVIAADDVGLTGVELRVDGQPVELAADGTARVYFSAPGNGRLEAFATDAAGNRGTALARVSMRSGEEDGSGNPAPEATITSVTDGLVVGGFVDVIGTAVSPDFERYVLSYRRIDQSSYKTILTSTIQVTTGSLGKWDTTLLENDNYILKLEVYDTFGSFAAVEVEVSVSGNLKLGNFRLSFEDMTIPVAGIPITIARTYDTLRADRDGDFGYGWRLEYRNTDLRTSLPKSGLEDIGIYTPFKQGTKVFITLPGGKREGFTFTPEIKVLPGFGRNNNLVLASPRFTPDKGVTSTLSTGSGQLTVNEFGELYAAGGIPWNPASEDFGGYRLTTKEGIQYHINGATGLMTSARDRNGTELRFTESGIVSASGMAIEIARDRQGRISSITDPSSHKLVYEYSTVGDLIKTKDREGHETILQYLASKPHYLELLIDPLGRTGLRNEYDTTGRLVRQISAGGNSIAVSFDPNNSVVTNTDALGNATNYEYDNRGNIVTETNALGGTTHTVYNDLDLPIAITDPLGRVTRISYDSLGNETSRTDPAGNAILMTYGAFSSQTSFVDAMGNRTTVSIDTAGNPLVLSSSDGSQVTMAYSNNGTPTTTSLKGGSVATSTFTFTGSQPTKIIDAVGNSVQLELDSSGRTTRTFITVTMPLGQQLAEQRVGFDASGRVLSVANALSEIERREFDAAGNLVATVNPLGHRTVFSYDAENRLIRTVNRDSTTETNTYDAVGRLIAKTDGAGHETRYEYDAKGRQTVTVFPDETPALWSDNPRFVNEYDAADQLLASTDELGRRKSFEWDLSGNLIATTNAKGAVTRYAYDGNRKVTSILDPLDRRTIFEYDALSRLIRTRFADGTSESVVRGIRGEVLSKSDRDGATTRFEYDNLGRLTAVIDPLAQKTIYSYDELGRHVKTVDANGHATHFEYDLVGRITARILPSLEKEVFSYDRAGRLVRSADFVGNVSEFEYDSMDRLTKIRRSDETFETDYNQTGQRLRVRDARGVTQYTYDARSRLIRRTEPDNRSISYAYDAVGNVTNITTTVGSEYYAYDALNFPQTVTDTDGTTTTFEHDTVGNLIETRFPNGVVERRERDSLDRVKSLRVTSQSGLIERFDYMFDLAGRRAAIVQKDGRRVDYEYDDAGRLIRESVADATAGNRVTSYEYDRVGNRLIRIDSAEGTTNYTYDQRDRLTQEIRNLELISYTYDANGNLTSRDGGSEGSKRFTWNSANRLVRANVAQGQEINDIEIRYDIDGNRVERKINGNSTRFLVDGNRRDSQVIEEYLPEGTLVTSHVYGPNAFPHISQKVGGDKSFLHGDHLGSTLIVTDTTGTVVTRLAYDAFGKVLAGRLDATEYLFADEPRDRLVGLDYLRARSYDPATGRFVSQDPFAGSLNSPISLHRYVYANADPINNRDPSGKNTLGEQLAVTTIIGTLNGLVLGTINSKVFGGSFGTGFAVGFGIGFGFSTRAFLQFASAATRVSQGVAGLSATANTTGYATGISGFIFNNAVMGLIADAGFSLFSFIAYVNSQGLTTNTKADKSVRIPGVKDSLTPDEIGDYFPKKS